MRKNFLTSLFFLLFISSVVSSLSASYQSEEVLASDRPEKKSGNLSIQIIPQRSQIQVNEEISLPAMVSMKSSGGDRSNVDLVAVVDVSGSMMGDKIDLTKQALKYVLNLLTPNDRLSIITFSSDSQRLINLKHVTAANKLIFLNQINGLVADGSTNIMSGMDIALKTLRDRKTSNEATSVFLLSDGQNNVGLPPYQTLAKALKSPENSDIGPFSIHTFGFGNEHDQFLMTNICRLKGGEFYYIKQLSTLDEAFTNSLGGIISLAATDVEITIKNRMEEFTIAKTYGPFWVKLTNDLYKIRIEQMISGVSKDFIFMLKVPSFPKDYKSGDGSELKVIDASFTAKGINGKSISGSAQLKLTLVASDVAIDKNLDNVDVIQNNLRVQATEVMANSIKYAEKNNFDQAKKQIEDLQAKIKQNPLVRQANMETVTSSLSSIKSKLSKDVYAYAGGRKEMVGSQNQLLYQNGLAFGNAEQNAMVSSLKMSKSN